MADHGAFDPSKSLSIKETLVTSLMDPDNKRQRIPPSEKSSFASLGDELPQSFKYEKGRIDSIEIQRGLWLKELRTRELQRRLLA